MDVSIATPQICSDTYYKSFWIILQSNGQLSVGIGNVPGVDCVASLDDSMYHALRSGVDAVKYVGVGNSALGRKARDLKVRNLQVMSIPSCFQDSIIPITAFDPLKHERDGNGNHGGDYSMEGGDGDGGDGGGGNDNHKDTALWAEYQKECEKAKKRAIKFNIEYKQPAPDAFFKWSEARRMRANPERGFITGMDIMSTEEKEKAGKRKERFEAEEKKNRELGIIGNKDDDNHNDGEDEDMQDENDNEESKKKKEPYPLEQAWDNLELVEQFRSDPPENISMNTESEEHNMNEHQESDDAITATAVVTHVPEKIHIFAIDWAAFKQIRTDDIMAYFSMYGPSYVEWLGELSCNVLFGDKYSAARALEGTSRSLPLDIPSSLLEKKDQEESNISAGETEMTDVDITANEDEDDAGKSNTENDTYGTTMDESTKMEEDGNNIETTDDSSKLTNLGKIGWRFCNYPIRKRQDDRYGRRGTRSRILMRVANSLDVLEERPTSWPKPPPGFTTRHVLGPGSDFKKKNSRKRGASGSGDGGAGEEGEDRLNRELSAKRRRRNDGGSYREQ